MKAKIAFLASTLTIAAGSAMAGGPLPQVPTRVPEISALEGTAAIAALAAIVALVWERRRRSA
ncbi:hypothetical protein [Actibacterium ureilyticum]|uniref:hypothetical protein n=1 Tax=Actibacterium ureilyticum TaxID=1590614 RepID=UPI000BAAB1ED|nr:hypothetical protein [Actibacterium ureilyticum]